MSWEMLPVNYTDAVWSGLKRYNEIGNEDGTVSFQDVTTYSGKEKSFFSAKDANRMNTALNTLMSMVENGTNLYAAFQEYFDTQKVLFENEADAFESQQEAAFTSWFNSIKNQLSGDVAGNLVNRIDALDTKTTQMQTTSNQYYHDGMMFLPSYQEKMVVMTGDAIDVTLASVFKKEVSSAVTLSFSSTDSIGEGYVYSLLLVLKMTASVSVTFPTSVKWAGDTPALENGKTYEIVMRTYDGGTSWIASAGEGADNA